MVHAGMLVGGPHQLLDTVSPANIRTQIDERLPDVGVDSVGVEGITGTLDGDSSMIILAT